MFLELNAYAPLMLFPQVRLTDEESPRPSCSYVSGSQDSRSRSPKKAALKKASSKDSSQESSITSAVLQMLQLEKEMLEERKVWKFYFECR